MIENLVLIGALLRIVCGIFICTNFNYYYFLNGLKLDKSEEGIAKYKEEEEKFPLVMRFVTVGALAWTIGVCILSWKIILIPMVLATIAISIVEKKTTDKAMGRYYGLLLGALSESSIAIYVFLNILLNGTI